MEIYELMNRLTAQGAGILMISSELPEVLGMSDRILVMREGRLRGGVATPRAPPRSRCSRAALGQRLVSSAALAGAQGASGRHAGSGSLLLVRAAARSSRPHFLTVSNLLNVIEQTVDQRDHRGRA